MIPKRDAQNIANIYHNTFYRIHTHNFFFFLITIHNHHYLPTLRAPHPLSYHILWEFVAWKILDILVLCVDDLGKLFAIDHFFIHPHLDCCGKALEFLCIGANNPCNCRAPWHRTTQQYL